MAKSDDVLIKEILNGNESSMEILVKRYYDMVNNFIYRNVGEYNISYDLTQETFIKMMKNLQNFKSSGGQFKNWLLKITLNVCRDYFKSYVYKQRVSILCIGIKRNR